MLRESLVIILNSFFYIALFVFCFFRYRKTNLSVALSFLYMINAICGLLLFHTPFYAVIHPASDGICTIQASVYLFVVNALFILAFSRCNIGQLKKLSFYNRDIIKTIQITLCVLYTIYVTFQLPESFRFFMSSNDLSELRALTYEGGIYERNPVVKIIQLFVDLQLLLLCIVFVNFFLFKRTSKWDMYSIILIIALKTCGALGWISRVAIVFPTIEVGMLLLLFYHYIPQNTKKRILHIIMIAFIPIYFFMTAVSTDRFDKNEAGRETYSFLLYAGEGQINFMALAWNYLNQPFYGYRHFSTFRKYLGLDYPKGRTRDGTSAYDIDIQKKFHYFYPTYIFYNASGFIFLNFGGVITLIVAILFFLFMRRAYKNPYCISFMTIVCTIYFAGLFGKGIFYLDYFSKSGNIMILQLLVLYLVLKNYGVTYNYRRLPQ